MTFFEKKITQVEKHKGPPYVSGYILVSDTFARFWLSPVSVSFGIIDSPHVLRKSLFFALFKSFQNFSQRGNFSGKD